MRNVLARSLLGSLTARGLPQEAALIGIEAQFEHLIAPIVAAVFVLPSIKKSRV